jgi:ABC-type antimicrobial peptide transport system permease subunit
MWAFIIAGIVLVGSVLLALFIAFAQGMATAPSYDDTPRNTMIGGAIIAALIAGSHWFPHLGW